MAKGIVIFRRLSLSPSIRFPVSPAYRPSNKRLTKDPSGSIYKERDGWDMGFFLEIDSGGIFERLRVLEFLICGIRLFAIFVINLSYFRKCIFVLSRSILFVCCSVFENFKDSRII